MSKFERSLIDRIRTRIFYDQPIYIPGYRYSPWKIWLVLLTGAGLVAWAIIDHFWLNNH